MKYDIPVIGSLSYSLLADLMGIPSSAIAVMAASNAALVDGTLQKRPVSHSLLEPNGSQQRQTIDARTKETPLC